MVGFLGIVWREEDGAGGEEFILLLLWHRLCSEQKRTCDQRNGFLSTGADSWTP